MKQIQPEAQMMQFILGKWISKPIHVAAELEIADILAEGNMKIEELSERTETHTESLFRLLRALSGVGIFKEFEKGIFSNTPLSECLMEGKLKSASLLFHSEWHDRMWDNLIYSIRTGKSAFENEFSESVFKWFQKHPDEADLFHKANSFKAAFTHRAIIDVYDFKDINTITDIGGGLGGLMFEILKANPQIRGVIADLPEVIQLIKPTIMESKSENRLQTIACDFLCEIPQGSDAYLLSNILHDWPDETCMMILKNCRKVMKTEGKIIIIESIIPPGNEFSISKLLDLEVLLMGRGKERTEDEYQQLLQKTGFNFSRIIHTCENVSVIEGIPASM